MPTGTPIHLVMLKNHFSFKLTLETSSYVKNSEEHLRLFGLPMSATVNSQMLHKVVDLRVEIIQAVMGLLCV